MGKLWGGLFYRSLWLERGMYPSPILLILPINLSLRYNIIMIKQFLEQSNNIENVFDKDSLKQAVKAWEYVIGKKKLTSKIILNAHGILMFNHLPVGERGCFRRVGVRIGASYGLHYVLIPKITKQWCIMASKPEKTEDQIKWDHVHFEKIHPFIDGNGRIGRILLNWQRIINKLPILIIKNSEKQFYYRWFK